MWVTGNPGRQELRAQKKKDAVRIAASRNVLASRVVVRSWRVEGLGTTWRVKGTK